MAQAGRASVLFVQVPSHLGGRRRGGQGVRGHGPVAEPELSFAGLLRQLRAEAKLTQEELAAAAGLSPRSISDFERGVSRTAHKDTGVLLANALSLAGPLRILFVAAARGKTPASEVLAAREEVAPGTF